jgi:hypothetical protein
MTAIDANSEMTVLLKRFDLDVADTDKAELITNLGRFAERNTSVSQAQLARVTRSIAEFLVIKPDDDLECAVADFLMAVHGCVIEGLED